MTKPRLTASEFITRAPASLEFLNTYLKDPFRLRERYEVDDEKLFVNVL